MSGYVCCNCRDCCEIAIASDGESGKVLCADCKVADCAPHAGECQAPGAYGVDEMDDYRDLVIACDDE